MEEVKTQNNLISELSFKDEFIQIGEKRKQTMLTKEVVEELYHEYDFLLEKHDVKDLEYRIDFDKSNQIVTFVPIRKIDKLAMKSLLTL